MPDILKVYLLGSVSLIFAVLLLHSWYSYNELEFELEQKAEALAKVSKKLEESVTAYLALKIERDEYKHALEIQSQVTLSESQKLETAKKELAKWKADAKRYQVIESHLPNDSVIKRSNCEDVKDYFDGLSNFNLDSLQ